MARILFIDDDATIRALACAMLTASGHQVTLAENGRAGMDLYHKELFELVVTDIFMPEQDGIETIEQIRKLNRITPILAISSSHRDREYLRAATALGATATLLKPFQPEQLIEAVDRLLAFAESDAAA
jgi:two-component system, chemotaxis family, chemotaxis protein CheY